MILSVGPVLSKTFDFSGHIVASYWVQLWVHSALVLDRINWQLSEQGARETPQLVAPHGLRQKSHSWPCLGEGNSAISKFWALSAREIPQIASCGTGHEGNSTTSGLSAQSARKTPQLPAVWRRAEEIRQLASFSIKGSKNR